ncbi:hypothetical protein [Dokdonella sp.]|uniref:hypothetical protein n=1 Tax=Dokdonella sp. TaxID=2291710 RepID=UPI001AFD8054|nr:hypothetical protein [Dokdonella sp.]MBO9662827.1 hypothetical protein [Dokdonella sp.]
MRIKGGLSLTATLGLAAAIGGWLLVSRERRVRAETSAPAVAATVKTDPSDAPARASDTRAGAKTPAAPDLPAPDVPANRAIEALRALAEQGRPDAMRELSMRLMYCAGADSEPDEEIRRNALKRFYWRNGHEPATELEIGQVAAEVEDRARRREDCTGVDPALLENRVAWLEKAARAGDARARLDYANWGLHGMGREDILMHPDEVERRRQTAADLLQQALAAGDCDALPLLADAYRGQAGQLDWLFQPSPSLMIAYAQADRLRHGEDARADIQAAAQGAAEKLDAAQRAAALRQGETLFARHCRAPSRN